MIARKIPDRAFTHLVDDQEVRLGDTRAALPGNLVTARNVNHVDDVVGELSRVVGYGTITLAFGLGLCLAADSD